MLAFLCKLAELWPFLLRIIVEKMWLNFMKHWISLGFLSLMLLIDPLSAVFLWKPILNLQVVLCLEGFLFIYVPYKKLHMFGGIPTLDTKFEDIGLNNF